MNDSQFSYLFKFVIVGESGKLYLSNFSRRGEKLSRSQLHRTETKKIAPDHDRM